MKDHLILGLDLSKTPLHLVLASFDDHIPHAEEFQSFYSLNDFERYLQQCGHPGRLHLAVSGHILDPLGVLPSLREQGYEVKVFPLAERLPLQYAPRVPETHRFAYTLASLVAVKAAVPRMAEHLADRLVQIQGDLNCFLCELELLGATITEKEHEEGMELPGVGYYHCPF